MVFLSRQEPRKIVGPVYNQRCKRCNRFVTFSQSDMHDFCRNESFKARTNIKGSSKGNGGSSTQSYTVAPVNPRSFG